MATIYDAMNQIRLAAGTEYQARVPLATRDNISAVGNPIVTHTPTMNTFVNLLMNRIAFTEVHNRTYSNPLASPFKKGNIALGADIQEIMTNPAKDAGFDPTGSKLLTRTIPDTKVLYHRLNRQGQYPITITRDVLRQAFVSWDKLSNYISSIINSMYSGDNIDEFILMKNLCANAITTNKVRKIGVDSVIDSTTATAFVKAVKKISGLMKYPSIAWNVYYENKPSEDHGGAVTTWTLPEDQALIIRSDVLTDINIDVLATAFNIDRVNFMTQIVEVDSFGSASGCLAMLVDKAWMKVYDDLYETGEFINPQGLYTNYWLNHWQVYSYSLFCNACAFVVDDVTISINKQTISFTTTATNTITATVTPSGATTVWISSNEAIATVAGGVVTPHANGTCYIQAQNGDATAICEVTVNIA